MYACFFLPDFFIHLILPTMKRIFLFCLLLLMISGPLWAQTRTVTGKVTSAEDGVGLPGVNVRLVNTGTGVVTDFDGNYRIEVPSGDASLRFTYVGFVEETIAVGNQSTIDVELYPDLKELSEVVVVGYGTQLKQDITGNIAKVGGEEIQNVPVPSVEQAIQGRAAGVQVTSLNGKVGQGISIRVRGSASITAGNEPLYVIDGVPVTSQNQSAIDSPTNPLADINFNDIESIEILKDASSAAIYGSRASNGVVLITTKKGKAGETKFNLNYQTGFSKPTGKREWLNAEEYIALYREAAYNNDLAEGYDPVNNPGDYPGSWLEYIEETFDFLAGDTDWRNLENDTDWQDQAFQDAGIQIFDISASGGSDKTQFYASGGYSDQEGILIGNRFERMSGRLNLNHELSSRFDLGLNVGISKTNNYRVTDDNEFATPMQLVAQSPLTPVRDKEGNLYDDALNTAMFYYPATVERENSKFLTTVYRNLANASLSYDLTDNVKLVGEYGFDLLTQNEERYQNAFTQTGRSVNGYGQSRWVRIFNYTTRALANYNTTFNDLHNLEITGGIEFQKSTRDQTNAEKQTYAVVDLNRLSTAAVTVSGSGTLNEFSFLSYVARANYKFNNRYLFGLSGRIDGSSRFGENNRYGFFPAVSAGWILSEESFLNNANSLSFLKLRASYGLTGNAEIPNYSSYGLYSPEAYAENGALVPFQLYNPDLTWETTAQLDIGLDFGLFNDRLTGELDYYNKHTKDLLLNVPLPGTSGYGSQLRNIGELENKGFELVLNYAILNRGDFRWRAGINLATNQNKILKLNQGQDIIDSGSSRWLNVVKVGEPIGVFYGNEYAGVNPANGDAIWYVNGDVSADEIDGETIFEYNGQLVTNNFNLANPIVLGNPNPDFFGGITSNFSYKGIELDILLQGQKGNKIFNGGGGFMSANGRYEDNQTRDQLRRWQQPGDVTDVPQARLYSNNGAQASSRYLYDGSYLRVKNVTLAYNLPDGLTDRIGLDRVRIYATGQNLLTFTDYEGWDPEVNTDYRASNISLGNDFYSAPQARTLTFGVKVGF